MFHQNVSTIAPNHHCFVTNVPPLNLRDMKPCKPGASCWKYLVLVVPGVIFSLSRVVLSFNRMHRYIRWSPTWPWTKRIKHVFGRKRFWSKKRALVIWCFWLQCFFLSWNPLHLISIQPYVASGDAIWVMCQSLALEAEFLGISWWSVQKETGRSRVEIPFGTWWFVIPQRALNLYVNILDTYTVYSIYICFSVMYE